MTTNEPEQHRAHADGADPQEPTPTDVLSTPLAPQAGLRRTAHWVVALEGCFLVAALPMIVALALLADDRPNGILLAIGAFSLGPALSAALHCVRRSLRDGASRPVEEFVRGYRLNATSTAVHWIPAVIVLALLLGDVRDVSLGGPVGDVALRIALPFLALVMLLWLVNMLAISTAFTFRQRDLVRLALYFVGASPRTTMVNLLIVFTAAFLLAVTSGWVVLLLAPLAVTAVAWNTRGMLREIELRFTDRAGPGAPSAVV